MSVSTEDIRQMAGALREARRGIATTTPNPRVGCILVKDGLVVGRGFHRHAGGPHAEVDAIASAGSEARGATAYVTLEPCAHHGRTGPCADALIAAGVRRVVVASEDPNPLVAGKGLARLADAGIALTTGVLKAQADALNKGFFRRIQGGLPWVRIKMAASLDGRTAMASGESKWITGPAARQDVQRLRAASCAIVTGVGTVLADDPRMDVRLSTPGDDVRRQPLRVVVDSQLRTPAGAAILNAPGSVMVCHATPTPAATLLEGKADLFEAGSQTGRCDLRVLLTELARRGCNEVLVEAGPTLAGAFLAARLIDEMVIYQAPTLLGSTAQPLFDMPLTKISEQIRIEVTEQVRVGIDTRITGRPVYPATDNGE